METERRGNKTKMQFGIFTFPYLHMKESLETVEEMRAVTVRDDPSSRSLLFICQDTQTGNNILGNRHLVT